MMFCLGLQQEIHFVICKLMYLLINLSVDWFMKWNNENGYGHKGQDEVI